MGELTPAHPSKPSKKSPSIKELLARIKDVATLMLDLAYATLIFRDKSLAEEVLALEREVDDLIHRLQASIMLVARSLKDAEALQSILYAARVTDRISNAIGDIVFPILRGSEPHPIVLEGLKRLDEPITVETVAKDSLLCRGKVDSTRLRIKLGIDVVAVRRKGAWLIGWEEVKEFKPEDMVLARGPPSGVEKFRLIARGSGA